MGQDSELREVVKQFAYSLSDIEACLRGYVSKPNHLGIRGLLTPFAQKGS
jgi:hypothetical protein